MARCLLPLATTLLISFTALSAHADADSTSPSATSSDLRAEVESKREHLTGAGTVKEDRAAGAQPLLDAPVVTDDAPTIDEQK